MKSVETKFYEEKDLGRTCLAYRRNDLGQILVFKYLKNCETEDGMDVLCHPKAAVEPRV